ncbi:MAG: hypothetical protein C0498_02700 [Anaerolinea sp.]|nr:hypothetical protein [Anaerolinea sp.]
MLTYLTSTCLPAYSTYTGTDFSAQDVFDVGWFQPTADGWKSGDQSVICYAYRLDEEKFKGSIKAG